MPQLAQLMLILIPKSDILRTKKFLPLPHISIPGWELILDFKLLKVEPLLSSPSYPQNLV